MALLIFPSNPINGQLFPVSPVAGQNQYQWDSADNTWRLLGAATGVTPGDYCSTVGSVPRFTVDAQGRITTVQCVSFDTHYVKTNNTLAYNSYIWPSSDGTAGQVLTTDGAGNLVWNPAGSGVIYGLGLALNGGAVKVSIPTVSPSPVVGTGALQAMPGSLYWDDTLGELFIYYDDGTTAQWISTTGGTTPPPPGYGLTVESSALKLAIPALPNPPTVGIGVADATKGSMYYDTALGVMFYYYDDGTTTQWVQV